VTQRLIWKHYSSPGTARSSVPSTPSVANRVVFAGVDPSGNLDVGECQPLELWDFMSEPSQLRISRRRTDIRGEGRR
jgi:hypothetical protein